MKLQTTKTEAVEFDVKIPSFYRLNSMNLNMVGIISERDVLEVYEAESMTMVVNKDAKTDITSKLIQQAMETGEQITEEEFMTAYNRALHSLSLTPELITKP